MAKVVISLLSAILVLNALTFLFVVSQDAPSGAAGAAPSQGPSKSAIDQLDARLQSLDASVKSLKGSFDKLDNTNRQLSSKLDSIPRQVAADVRRSLPVAQMDDVVPAPGMRSPPASARRTGPTDFSQPPVQPGGAAAGVEETDESLEDSGVEDIPENGGGGNGGPVSPEAE